MGLDCNRLFGKFDDFGVIKAGLRLVRATHFAPDCRLVRLGRSIDELGPLAANPAPQNIFVAELEGRLVDEKLVGVGDALDDRLAETPKTGDHHHVAVAAFRIQREDHPG